jgi:hypothetical protein
MATVPLGLGDKARSSLVDRVDAAGVILTVITNVMVTAMISTKLLTMYFNIRKYVTFETTRPYTNIISILVESAAPSAILGVFWTVLVLRQSIEWYMSVFLVWSTVIVRYCCFPILEREKMLTVLAVIRRCPHSSLFFVLPQASRGPRWALRHFSYRSPLLLRLVWSRTLCS